MTYPDRQEEKKALRRQARAARAALDPGWRAEASRRMHEHLLRIDPVREAETISLFVSVGAEVDTHPLIHAFLAAHKRVAVPCVLHAQRRLELRVIESFPDGFQARDFGILEPEPLHHPEVVGIADVDVILVPGLLFNPGNGIRLGYGGGYYDRLLAEEHQALAIALGFSTQLVAELPVEPWDRPVDAICTDAGWHPIRI
ncbi:MAG TPA: 5-formyltetrahydrofolate cyclo-ligase [Candidatus Sumerlaeota bacterium]|nr:5-formyltetrahydrofolate cyclo-ligase [Candidatus Sumerlaeota bacterium]